MSETTELDLSDTRDALKFLASLGIMKVTIGFDGGGDSGSLGDITFEGITEGREMLKPPELGDMTILDFVSNLADRLLEETQYDWYNNDGGFGTITIVPGDEQRPLHVDMNVRFISTNQYEFFLNPESGGLTEEAAPHNIEAG
jgi:hypothetical protein